jgi:hypothetical protein
LRFKCGDKDDINIATKLYAWCDASHAAQADSKSHVGTCFSVGLDGPMFYCRSVTLKENTTSSCQSELGGAVEATQDLIWMRNLFDQLGFEQDGPTPLYTDNASLVTLATQYSGNHKRVRHFVTKLNWMISQVQDGIVDMIHLPGEENPADTLTKPLSPILFEKCRRQLFNHIPSSVSSPPDVLSSSFSASAVQLVPVSLLRSSLSTPASKLLRRSIYDLLLHQRQTITLRHNKELTSTINKKWIKFPKNMFTFAYFNTNDPPQSLLI